MLALLALAPAYHWSLPQRPTAAVAGHASAAVGGRVYAFGGLRPAGQGATGALRAFDGDGWEELPGAGGAACPAPRMYAAAAAVGDEVLVCGGWDPGAPRSGGRFFDDAWLYDPARDAWRKSAATLPGGPASRHVALGLGDGTALVHTFRCAGHVLVYDGARDAFDVVPTTGRAPAGLSMMAAAHHPSAAQAVFVGGATRAQAMSAAVHALDTRTWTWTRTAPADAAAAAPPPRASCAAAALRPGPLSTRTLVFGGAAVGDDGHGGGLRSTNELWRLAVTRDGARHAWTRVAPDGAARPPPRVAARLDWAGPSRLVLHGGWRPETNVTHVLTYFLSVFPDAA